MEDFWAPSKRLLGDIQFLQKLKEFDKDHIPPDRINKVRLEYLPNKNFAPNIVAKASRAARGVCKWIIALDKYDTIMKVTNLLDFYKLYQNLKELNFNFMRFYKKANKILKNKIVCVCLRITYARLNI